jgi:hypothetical protein
MVKIAARAGCSPYNGFGLSGLAKQVKWKMRNRETGARVIFITAGRMPQVMMRSVKFDLAEPGAEPDWETQAKQLAVYTRET